MFVSITPSNQFGQLSHVQQQLDSGTLDGLGAASLEDWRLAPEGEIGLKEFMLLRSGPS